MSFVASGPKTDVADTATATHELRWFRMEADEQGQALRGICPMMQWEKVPGVPGADRPLLTAGDAFAMCYTMARGMTDAVRGLRWIRHHLRAKKVQDMLAWALGRVASTRTSWGGLLKRLAAAAKAHDNADGALTLAPADYISIAETDAARRNAQAWLGDEFTLGLVAGQDEGMRALAWLEWHRTGYEQIEQPLLEAVHLAAIRCSRVENYGAVASWDAAQTTAVSYAVAVTLARGVAREPACAVYRVAGVSRAAIGREDISVAGMTIDGNTPYYMDRIAAMIETEAAVCGAEDAGALALMLLEQSGVSCSLSEAIDLIAELAQTMLPPAQAAPARLFTPLGIRALMARVKKYHSFLALPVVQAMEPMDRLYALQNRMGEGSGRASEAWTASSTEPGPRADGAITGYGQRLAAEKEVGNNPSILAHAVEMCGTSFDKNALLQLLLVAATTAQPTRRGTGLTHQLAAGTLPGHVVDQRLAITSTLWEDAGGGYLGTHVGKQLVDLGFALAEQVRGLKLDALAKAVMRTSGDKVDFYNDLVIAVLEHIHTHQASQGAVRMARVPAAQIYKDFFLNLKLPKLVHAVYKALGRHFSGEHSVSFTIEQSNAFMMFNVGVTEASTRFLTEAQAELFHAVTGEERAGYAPTLDARNCAAAIPAVQLRGADTEGGRGEWKRKQTLAQKAAVERQSKALTETLHGALCAPTAAGYVATNAAAAGAPVTPKAPPALAAVTPTPNWLKPAAGTPTSAAAAQEALELKAAREAAKKQQSKEAQEALIGAKCGFKDNGKTFYIGSVEYDAERAAKDNPGICIGHLFTKDLPPGAPTACDDPTSEDHKGPKSKCHAKCSGVKASWYNIKGVQRRMEFNEKRKRDGDGGGSGAGRGGGSRGGGKSGKGK